MTSKIFRSTLLVAVIVLLCSLSVVMGFLYRYFDGVLAGQLEDELSLAAIGVEQDGIGYLEGVGSDRFRITWIDRDGTVLYDTQVAAQSMENHSDREEFREAVKAGRGSAERFSNTLTEKTVYVAGKLDDGTILRVSASRASSGALMIGMLPPILAVVVLAVILSAFLARRMARRIVQPLNTLDLDHPLENDCYEEMDPLLRRIDQQMKGLKNAERTRREFSANVSHELKTPLQAIIGSAELLENGLVKPEDTPRFVGHIRKEAVRLVSLIQDIIRISSLDEGVELPREKIDILLLAEEVKQQTYAAAQQKEVKVSVCGEPCTVEGVRGLLYEMLYNLCDNAIKYNVSGGSVTIHAAMQGDHPMLTVSDTGIGIPEEYQDRVFERFFRVDKSHSRLSGGTGLGLSIVKHAAQYHNAEISLKSTPGKGTAITVRF